MTRDPCDDRETTRVILYPGERGPVSGDRDARRDDRPKRERVTRPMVLIRRRRRRIYRLAKS